MSTGLQAVNARFDVESAPLEYFVIKRQFLNFLDKFVDGNSMSDPRSPESWRSVQANGQDWRKIIPEKRS